MTGVRISASMTLGNTAIDQLLADSRALTELPFLRRPAVKTTGGRGCGACGKKAAAASAPTIDYNTIKRQIAQLPADRQQLVKELLGTQRLVIIYSDGGKIEKKVVS